MDHLSRRYDRIWQEIARLKEMDKALADAPDGQISLTDPNALSIATSARHSGLVGYNFQCAVNTVTHLIVAHEVTNQGFYRDQLSPMAHDAKEALGRDELHALADKGYFSGPEILACHEANITTTVPRPATSGNAAKGMYVKADFVYDADRDVYVCPAGEDLTYRNTTEERSIPIRRYWINGCKTCPLRSKCTIGNERRISRWEREDLVDDMDSRLGRDPDYMTLRRCTVEHEFGTMKAWMGGAHFLTRRLENVRSEMALNVLAYNIKRVIALLGFRGLIQPCRTDHGRGQPHGAKP